ncbi:MAG: PH domain-containing protein, partial [Candidatus Uhrbacteria bacterium]|nr:PH domain-containing protein [Candidatus Uhrbacteria bacterium]
QSQILESAFWGPIIALAGFTYLLIVFLLTITEFTDYWLDVWVVTTERIINSEQHGLFNRAVSELHLDQIQDITSETKGFMATFLTYGDVFIQTAAEKIRFHFKNIDNPELVKQTIGKLIKECETSHAHSHVRPTQKSDAPTLKNT